MIVRDRLSIWRVWPQATRRLLWLLVFDTTIAVSFVVFDVSHVSLPNLPLAMMGGALSIFLAFRNNSAYDRWWEARTLWGGLVNTCRTFTRQILTMTDGDDAPKRELVRLQALYVHVLRCHLRRQNPFPELQTRASPELIAQLRPHKNVPIALLQHMAALVRKLFDAGRLESIRFTRIDVSLTALCDIQGGCERIKTTPLPRQYEYLPRVLVSTYCVLLPLGLVSGMGLLTPIASTLVSFIFISLEAIGRDLEDPFETTVHDTPLSQLSRTIEINLKQSLGDTSLPAEVRPIDGFVY